MVTVQLPAAAHMVPVSASPMRVLLKSLHGYSGRNHLR